MESDIPVLLIVYEDLKANLKLNLRRIADFVNVTASEEDLDCVVHNSEGNYHRVPAKVKATSDEFFEALTNGTISALRKVQAEEMQWIQKKVPRIIRDLWKE